MLELDQLVMDFSGFKAVNECTFKVEEGSITGLIGPNGAGKTTLFNLIAGALHPTSGSIKLYNAILGALLPTPSRPHYTFNLRDLGKIFQGMLMTDVKQLQTGEDVMQLWLHECQRVFRDRLINDDDRGWFDKFMRAKFEENNMVQDEVVSDHEFLLYGDFM